MTEQRLPGAYLGPGKGRWTPAEGLVLISYSAEEGPGREQGLLELVIREDGGLRLIWGRGTDTSPPGGFPSRTGR